MHDPNRATIVKSRGNNGLKQAKLQTNSVTTLQLCVLLLSKRKSQVEGRNGQEGQDGNG